MLLVSNNRYEVCSLKPCQKCITPKLFLEQPFAPGRFCWIAHIKKKDSAGERGKRG